MPAPKLDPDQDGEGRKHNVRIPDPTWGPALNRMTSLRRQGYTKTVRNDDGSQTRRAVSVALAVRLELDQLGRETEKQTIARLGLVKEADA